MASLKIIEEELRRIWNTRGSLIPREVVAEAADPDSPLHDQFEWDDNVAGDRFRRIQAARMIRSVKLRVTTETASGAVHDVQVRQWLSADRVGDSSVPAGSYVPADQVLEPGQRNILR